MTLFFLLGRLLHTARRAVLGGLEVLPRLPLLLLMQPNGAHPHIASGAEHREDGALSSWHSREMVLMTVTDCKTYFVSGSFSQRHFHHVL